MFGEPNLLRTFIKMLPEVWDRFILRLFAPITNIIISIKSKALIHPFAKIDIKGVEIGQGSKIGNSLLQTYGGKGKIKIGANTVLYDHCELFAHRDATINIGDDVFLARRSAIMTADHLFEDKNRLIREQDTVEGDVTIGNDVWIGYGVIILKGVTINDGCVVGAGSVVTKDLPPYSVAVGSPAKVVKVRN